MRLRAGNVLGIEALVEVDRGVDALHDLGRAAGKAAAPERVRRGRVLHGIGHVPEVGRRNVVKMRLSRAVILAVVLCVPAVGWAAFDLAQRAAEGGKPPQMPEFNPTVPS